MVSRNKKWLLEYNHLLLDTLSWREIVEISQKSIATRMNVVTLGRMLMDLQLNDDKKNTIYTFMNIIKDEIEDRGNGV
ncbi:MAG: hypothetical protein V3V41_08015 [Candidatus Heimdallarchaeota archaeon]